MYRIGFVLLSFVVLIPASAFAIAAPEIYIQETGYPEALFYSLSGVEGGTSVTVRKDGVEVSGSVEVKETIHVFRPDEALLAGDMVEMTVSATEAFDEAIVTIIERSPDRGFTVENKPEFHKRTLARKCCDEECEEETEWRPGASVNVTPTAPLFVEARLELDGQIAATRVVNLSRQFQFDLIADTAEGNEMCVVIFASDFDSDETVQMEEECFTLSEIESPSPTTISDEIAECHEEQQANRPSNPSDSSDDKSDAACSSVSASSNASPFMVLFVLFCVARRRRR